MSCHDGTVFAERTRPVMTTTTNTDTVKVTRKDALEAVMSAMDTLVKACNGNAADALHMVVYGHDVSTRMQALYRYIPSGPDELGKALTVRMRYGGYDVTVKREEGRPDVTISCPDVTLVDKNGFAYDTDKYGATGADNLAAAVSKINPAIGRLGHIVATAQMIPHIPKTDTPATVKTRTRSASDTQVAELQARLTAQDAKLDALLAAITGQKSS